VGRGKNLDNVLKLAVIVQLGSPSALFRWWKDVYRLFFSWFHKILGAFALSASEVERFNGQQSWVRLVATCLLALQLFSYFASKVKINIISEVGRFNYWLFLKSKIVHHPQGLNYPARWSRLERSSVSISVRRSDKEGQVKSNRNQDTRTRGRLHGTSAARTRQRREI
jgi:hypothetical protein